MSVGMSPRHCVVLEVEHSGVALERRMIALGTGPTKLQGVLPFGVHAEIFTVDKECD